MGLHHTAGGRDLEPTDEVSASMTRLAAACGLDTVQVDITFTSITMCCRRGRAVVPVLHSQFRW